MKTQYKTLLITNDESSSEGLKLIQVNDGFVVIDINKDVEKHDYYWYNNSISRAYKNALMYNKSPRECYKIIFATANLNLENVPFIKVKPHFLDSIISRIDLISEFLNTSQYDFIIDDLKEYKQSQQNLFTEEHIRKAIEFGRLCGLYDGNCHDKRPDYYDENDKYIQSLKQSKAEITFENDVPIKAVII